MKRISGKHLSIAVLLALALVTASGCMLFEIPTSTPTPPPMGTNPPGGSPINPAWTPPSGNSSASLPSIADVVAKVRPSVVAINTEVVAFDIFNQPITQQGAGSGWVIDSSGLIVTNNHVVEGARTVTVTLSDHRVFTAESVRTDPITDLAVVKISATGLSAFTAADTSKLRVGDWVVAIGNPLGLGISAKEGIVSRLGVAVEVSAGQTLYDLIETSAAINPGNSGGPLVNMAGEVIGITSVKVAEVGVEGLGYAINISTALPIIQDLVTTGRVSRPWLGVVIRTVDEGVATTYGLAVNQGALITQITRNSPADRAGLRTGDVIVRFSGRDIASSDDLIQAIRTARIGQTVEIVYWRASAQNTTSATLAENPAP